jgi:hypothetical protein
MIFPNRRTTTQARQERSRLTSVVEPAKSSETHANNLLTTPMGHDQVVS